MSHHEEAQATEEAPKRRGRPASPLTPVTKEYEKAKAKADKARAAYQKVQDVTESLREAEAAEQDAYEELQRVLEQVAPAS